jgi:hypothetical protein
VTINRSVQGAGESEGHGGEVDETGRRPRTGGGGPELVGAEVHHAGVVRQRQALRGRRRPGRLHAAGNQRREILRTRGLQNLWGEGMVKITRTLS